jgi:hypothetical protein
MRVTLCQPQFVPDIIARIKQTTLRTNARCKPGDILSFRVWTGLPRRSKQRIFGTAECLQVETVVIRYNMLIVEWLGHSASIENVGTLASFARRDGFASYADLIQWFQKNHPGGDFWEMDLIYWGDTFEEEKGGE